MARRVFDSYHAPEDEVARVRAALDQARIGWFETARGRWWVGSAAIWVKDNAEYAAARAVIDDFQAQWRTQPGCSHVPQGINWKRVPLVVAGIALVIYLMTFWFWL